MIKVVLAIILAIGLYLMFAQVFEVADYKSVKVILNLDKKKTNKKKTSVLMYRIAETIEPYIKLKDTTKERLELALRSIGDKSSAEMFYAIGFAKAGIFAIAALIIAFIYPALSVILMIIGVTVFNQHLKNPENYIKEWRSKINKELPRFIAIIEQELKKDRTVFAILEYYQTFAVPEFADEIRTTLAAMRTGNQIKALYAMDSRIKSKEMSDVIKGLVKAVKGEEPLGYFSRISDDFQNMARTYLDEEVNNMPDKVKKYEFLAYVMIIITIFMMMGIYTYQQAKGLM